MARACEVCNKSVSFGHNVSHSNVKTNRRWLPNIQTVRAIVKGQKRRISVCTRCLRSGKVERTI